MSESVDEIETQNAIDDAIADIERACRGLAEHDHHLADGIPSIGSDIYDCAKKLTRTSFHLNHLRSIYTDAVKSMSSTVNSREESEDLMETVKKIEASVSSGSDVYKHLLEQGNIESRLPTEFPTLNSLRSVLRLQSASRSRANRSLNASQELEVLEDESEGILIDPVSKKPIERPVRNVKCKHVYDKNSIMKFISSSSNPRCPTMGCMNRAQLNARMLEDVNWWTLYVNCTNKDSHMIKIVWIMFFFSELNFY